MLFWLKDHPSRWGVFFANRCSEIRTLLPDVFWHHVRSADNPADVISQGIEPSKLASHNLWWNILPADCHFTTLLIRDAHQRTLHGGVQLTLATLRHQYWIVKGRSAVKKVIRACLACSRHAARMPTQLMVELPKARCAPLHRSNVLVLITPARSTFGLLKLEEREQ